MGGPGKAHESNDPAIQYAVEHSLRESAALRHCREYTKESVPMSVMLLDPLEGQLIAMICRLLNAKKTLDIGVYTGYSALAIAESKPDVNVIACDVSEEYTNIAKRFWKEAGVEERIDLQLRPAVETLDALIAQGDSQIGTFDFAFVDADKTSYDQYLEKALLLLRKGGIIVFDNVWWSGHVLDPEDSQSEDTKAIAALNRKLKDDDRIDIVMLPFADGVSVCMKK